MSKSNEMNERASTPHPISRTGVRLRSAHDCLRLLAKVTNRLLRGEMDSQTAGRVGYLMSVMLGAFETVEIEKRVRYLEELAVKRQREAEEREQRGSMHSAGYVEELDSDTKPEDYQ